jgi:cellulose synthase (UDP-forming)
VALVLERHVNAAVVALAGRAPLRVAVLSFAAVLLAVYATIDLPLSAHLLLSTAFVVFGYWIARRAPELRIALAFLSIAASLRYVIWRGVYTLGLDTPRDLALAWALYGAEVYGLFVLVAGYFQTAVLRPRRPVPLPADPATWPTVDVFIPTYDESPELVRRTLIGAQAMNYPRKRIHLLDDGRRPAMRKLAEDLGVEYRIRSDNAHAKAGNINAALAVTDGDFVAIFDCDHVPVRSFLSLTLGLLVDDPRLALVQTPHHFYNPDPFERNLWLDGVMPPEQQVFYHAVQLGNDFWNSVLFCGSCAVLRRTALVGIGGIAQETVTEDAHTSMRLLAAGWRSAYFDVPQAAGLATERYAFHVAQRIRWARGMTQILRLDNPLFKPGLTIAQRINYFNAIQHFQFGLPRLIFLVAPAMYLVFGLHPLAANPWEVLAYALPHMFLSVAGGLASTRSMRHAFWAEVYEAALAPYCAIVTLLALVAPRHGKFNVTVKGTRLDSAQFDWRKALPNLGLLFLVLLAEVLAPTRMSGAPLEAETLAITTLFNTYNALVLVAALAVALERPQQRDTHRVRRRFVARVWSASDPNHALAAETVDLSEQGIALAFAPEDVIPADPMVAVYSPDGWTRPMRIESRGVTLVDGRQRMRASLLDLDDRDRRRMVELMFCEPDSWIVRPSPSTTASAVGRLVVVPWRAAVATWRRSRAGAA